MDKRERSRNFTVEEKEFLFECVMKYKDIMENKKTDNRTNKIKNEAWLKICEIYNESQTSGRRDVKHLKILYDNLKMKARKEKSMDKMNPYKMSGGAVEQPSPIDNGSVGELGPLCEGIESPYDICSATYSTKEEDPTKSGASKDPTEQPIRLDFDSNIPPTVEDEAVALESASKRLMDYQAGSSDASNPKRCRSNLEGIQNTLSTISNSKQTLTDLKTQFIRAEHDIKLQILNKELMNTDLQNKILNIEMEIKLIQKQLMERQLQKLE